MAASIIDGAHLAAGLRDRIKAEVANMVAAQHAAPGLAVVLVGDNPASEVYVRNKKKMCEAVGMRSYDYTLPKDASRQDILAMVNDLNKDDEVDGILVQLPLPRAEDEDAVIQAINPEKDVDGFHLLNAGRLAIGQDGMVPCTPLGCMMMLKHTLGDISGKHAVVVGRSNIVGKPMAALLLRESATVTICHSRTQDLPARIREADILVAAVGKPEMIRGDWIKPGATIIDVGINRIQQQGDAKSVLVGDVHFAEASAVARHITPVPGGVGPMTIACLLHNTLKAACLRRDIRFTLASRV